MGFTASFRALLCGALATLPIVHAHGHHELAPIKPGEHQKPIDSILWIHMLLQAAIWGVVFPTGMVLGLSKSRWHVPLQSAALVLTVGGIFLGHAHGGRQFPASAHGRLGELIFFPIVTQAVLGIYLKLHIHEKTLRPYAVVAHGIVGKSYPIWGWVQMLFGGIVLRGYCVGGNINQCLAHYIMGSGFIGYGTIMAIMFVAGESWIRRHGRSPEFYDSAVITVWGLVNTFTEHLGGEWSVKDMQHTVMGGILWFTGGVLGLLLSRKNQRSLVPSIIIILTGWAMSNHEQALMISTAVHSMFGYTLMLAGLARIIEIIAFVPTYASPETAPSGDSASEHTLSGEGIMSGKENLRELGGKSFRHLPPFLMVASGLLFMSATDEELRATHDAGMDHVTYILIFYSLAFVVYTIIIGLITLYLNSGRNAVSATDAPGVELRETGGAKWYAPVPGSAREVASEHHIVGDDD